MAFPIVRMHDHRIWFIKKSAKMRNKLTHLSNKTKRIFTKTWSTDQFLLLPMFAYLKDMCTLRKGKLEDCLTLTLNKF